MGRQRPLSKALAMQKDGSEYNLETLRNEGIKQACLQIVPNQRIRTTQSLRKDRKETAIMAKSSEL